MPNGFELPKLPPPVLPITFGGGGIRTPKQQADFLANRIDRVNNVYQRLWGDLPDAVMREGEAVKTFGFFGSFPSPFGVPAARRALTPPLFSWSPETETPQAPL